MKTQPSVLCSVFPVFPNQTFPYHWDRIGEEQCCEMF